MQQELFVVATAVRKPTEESRVEDQLDMEERRQNRQRYLSMIAGFTEQTRWPSQA